MSEKPKFQQGDLVRHRASGRLAVVARLVQHCVEPEHQGAANEFRAHGPRIAPPDPPCRLEFSGHYDLNLNFEETVKAAEYLLEKADAES